MNDVDDALPRGDHDSTTAGGASISDDAREMIEFAVLALVVSDHLSERQFAMLYGPFWRSVVRRVRPWRSTEWNPM